MNNQVQPTSAEEEKAQEERNEKKNRRRKLGIILTVSSLVALALVAGVAGGVSTGDSAEDDTVLGASNQVTDSTTPILCHNDLCQHGGECSGTVDNFICTCVDGFEGERCEFETEVDECQPNPCENGAACVNEISGYECVCTAGYEGTHCELEEPNICIPNPCENGGVCEKNADAYNCTCPLGTSGDVCEINPDDCLDENLCNGGVCIDDINDYICDCTGGQPLVNVAEGKLVQQSSTGVGVAALATDGNSASDFAAGSCSETTNEEGPFWWTNLGVEHCISKIVIFTRQDAMASPLTGAVLIISNEPDMNGGAQCGEEVSDELAMEEIIEFECGDGITGQYVSVLIPNVTTTLSLCEVEIYAPLRRRFELVGSTNTWAEAKSLCSSRGGHLAKIENAEDQSYIVGLIGQSGLSPLTYGWYIGLNDRAIEGTRVWEDGSSLVGYTNWHPTEPNDGGNWGNGEDCTEISRDYNFKWNDVACSSSLFAICQYDDAW